MIIYLISCTCGVQYVGKTTREFRRRVGEHLGDIRNKRDTAVSRHIWQNHNGDANNICFQGIDKILTSKRRGNIEKMILQKESYWICTLKTITHNGLNEQLHYGCFIYADTFITT